MDIDYAKIDPVLKGLKCKMVGRALWASAGM